MGWFSADEIVAAPAASSEHTSNAAQTIGICVLAAVVTGYVLVRVLVKLNRQHTERVAERAARRVAVQV